MKVLILFAHPAFHKSRANKLLVEGLSELEGVTFRDLYQVYPESDIDVESEQKLLVEHDVIIFQFPLFWYSTPSLLKEWQDLVLEHGWAYGHKGNALKDKLFVCSLTTGGPKAGYQVGDFHNHTIQQLLAPLWQTAKLCKMKPLPPFVMHGTHSIEKEEIELHKQQLHQLLSEFITDRFQYEKALPLSYLNDYLTQSK